MGFLANILA